MSFDLGSAYGTIKINADLRAIDTAKRSLAEFERQAGTTGRAVGDNLAKGAAQASVQLNQADANMRKLAGSAQAVRGALAGAFTGSALAALGEFARRAAEEQAGLDRLAQAVENSGASFDDYAVRIDKAVEAGKALSFADDETVNALNTLTSATGDADRALALLAQAQDLSRAKGISLASASTLVGKVAQGNVAILARYGIVLKDGASATEALAELQKRFSGQATTYADTQLGAAQRIKNALDDLEESAGASTGALQTGLILLPGLSAGYTLLSGAIGAAVVSENAMIVASRALLVSLGPLGIILGVVGVGLGVLAKQGQDAAAAADAAKDPIDSLTVAIGLLKDEAKSTATEFSLDHAISEWQDLSAAMPDVEARLKAVNDELGKQQTIGATSPSAFVADQAAAASVKLQQEADALGRVGLTEAERADVEKTLLEVMNDTSDARDENIAAAEALIRSYNDERAAVLRAIDLWKEGTLSQDAFNQVMGNFTQTSEGMVTALHNIASGQAGVAKATLDGTEALKTHETAQERALRFDMEQGLRNQAKAWDAKAAAIDAATKATEDYHDAVARGQSALADQNALQTGMGFPGPTTGADVQDIIKDTQQVNINLAKEDQANADRRRELEQTTAETIAGINQDLADTLRDLDQQREDNARSMHRNLVTLERSTAQSIRELEGQAVDARAQAEDQLSNLAQQRADNAAALQKGLADAQEQANKQFADLAEQRVEIVASASDRMVEAEQSANDALKDLAQQRRDNEEATAKSMVDSREQAAAALVDVAKREVEIQTTLRESLSQAQEQYAEQLHTIAEAQGEVRKNLGEQLADLASAFRSQARDLDTQEKEIRATLRGSLREMRAEWNRINQENLSQQRQLRGEMVDTLDQNRANAKALQADLARIQGDPTFTSTEQDDAAFRTARALEALATDRQIAERDAQRTIASLEKERRAQQKQYETERENAVKDAAAQLRDLNKQRMEDEKAYHDRRIELEADAAEKIAGFNDQRREAAQGLADAEVEAHQNANDDMADLADQRVQIAQDAADREADIRDKAAGQAEDLAGRQKDIEQNLADARRGIREDLVNQMADLADREADIATDLASRQTDIREAAAGRDADLADQQRIVQEDLRDKLAAIENEKSIVYRDAAHDREIILREARNTAESIAKEEGTAVNDARQASEDAWDTLQETIQTERLDAAYGQGEAVGRKQGEGNVAGLNASEGDVKVAGTSLGTAVVTGTESSLENLRIAGQNMGSALLNGLLDKLKELEAAGKLTAKTAETGAKKEAEISSPSRKWTALGINMGTAQALALASTAGLNERAARDNVRRAMDAATSEFKRRRDLGEWTMEAQESARHQQRRDMERSHGGGRQDGGSSQAVQVQLILDRKVIDEIVVDVGIRGLRSALHRNPLPRRRM